MNNVMPNLPCTKITFIHLVPIFIEIQPIVLYMEYTAMKTDRQTDIQTQPKHYTFASYTLCKSI